MLLSRPFSALVAVVLAAALVRAQDAKKPLPAKHAKARLSCHDCHQKEAPSMAAVADQSCMVCHGDYPAMVAYTKNLNPNPHLPREDKHAGPFACTECHLQHKPPVVKCLECHSDFKMTAR
jgi:hypothetical protein